MLFLSGGRAVALGRHIFLPDAHAADAGCLAHELTHVRQYERWGPVRYYARGAWEQARHLAWRHLGLGADPYDWRRVPPRRFEAYGMEQQAQLVEDAMRGDMEARRVAGLG